MIIYTAIFGPYDVLHEPMVIPEAAQFVCFTDQPFRSDVWKIVQLRPSKHPMIEAKRYKLFPHEIFPGHGFSLWLDGCMQLRQDPEPLLSMLYDADMALFKHPARACSHSESFVNIMQRHDIDSVTQQHNAYYESEFPDDQGLYSGGFILREHNKESMKGLAENWWYELNTRSMRDQVSLPYVLWKTGIKPATIPGTIYNNQYAQWWAHTKEKTCNQS